MKTLLKFEEETLLAIFPHLVWSLIFIRLEADTSVVNRILHASRYWRTLLSSRRCKLLLPQVLPHLFPELYTSTNFNTHVNPALLKTRSVCQFWCKTVEIYCTYYALNKKVWINKLSYRNGDNPEKFLLHLDNTHGDLFQRNPFIGDSVSCLFSVDCVHHNNSILITPTPTVLQIYGHYIKHCELTLYNNISDPLEWHVEVMDQILQQMPNLKALHIQTFEKQADASINPERLQHLQDFKTLRFLNVENVSSKLTKSLISKSPNLETLTVKSKVNAYEGAHIMFPVSPLANLQHLTLISQSSSNPSYSDIRIPFITLSAHSGLRIKTLELYLPASCLIADHMHRLWRRYPLDLPCLTNLNVHSTINWPCLDFVGAFGKTLKSLKLQVAFYALPEKCSGEMEHDIGYQGCLESGQRPNIWGRLPQLEKFTVQQLVQYEFERDDAKVRKEWNWSRPEN